tara:strand:- start:382 stop:1143 length:762 start_codon:yes stop_codon:yes gene_type:complete
VTIIDFGGAHGKLAECILEKLETSKVLLLDMDINDEYSEKWRRLEAKYPGRVCCMRIDFLDFSMPLAKPFFQQDYVDYVFSHAASMYLNFELTTTLIDSFSNYVRYVFTRDIYITEVGLEIDPAIQFDLAPEKGEQPLANAIRDIYGNVQKKLDAKHGLGVGPMTKGNVNLDNFEFNQYVDADTYTADTPITCKMYMEFLALSLPNMIADTQTEAYLEKAREALRLFGKFGLSIKRLWTVTILTNKRQLGPSV